MTISFLYNISSCSFWLLISIWLSVLFFLRSVFFIHSSYPSYSYFPILFFSCFLSHSQLVFSYLIFSFNRLFPSFNSFPLFFSNALTMLDLSNQLYRSLSLAFELCTHVCTIIGY